jgi:chromosome segregation ATPase
MEAVKVSERTYKLLDGFILTEKNGRLYLHEGSNTPVPVPSPHTLIGDLLALVDSLQQQVNGLNEESLANFQTAAERGKQLSEAVTQIGELKRQLRRSDSEWANATNALVKLQEQLAERDRTIALLQEMDELHTSGAKQLVEDLHTLRVDRDKLQEALEQVQCHLHSEQYMTAESIVDAALGRE